MRAFFCLLLLIPHLSFATAPSRLKDLVNDYIYDLSVEWDQNNASYEIKRTEEFKKELTLLIKTGLTRQEIYEVFSSLDLRAIESELSLLDTSDAEMMTQFVAQKKFDSIKRGVDWRGVNPLLMGSFIGAGIWTVILLSNALDTQAEVL